MFSFFNKLLNTQDNINLRKSQENEDSVASYSAFKSTSPYQSVDKVRVAVIGDTAVGKTSLVHLLCHQEVLDKSTAWTLGCDTSLKIHEFHSKDYYIEFLDVGGALKHKLARPMLYHQLNGLIVVYDLTNKNSLSSIKKWIFEVLNTITPTSTNWVLKETDNPQILELESQIPEHSISDSSSIKPLQSIPDSTTLLPTTTSTTSNRLKQNQYPSTISLKQTPSVFLSQNSSFLPNSSTTSPTYLTNVTSSAPQQSTKKPGFGSANNKQVLNIPVIILGNKSDLYYDHKFIENDKLGRLSLIVSGQDKNSFKNGSYNAQKLDLFFNKMISNLMIGKKRNLTTMNFTAHLNNQNTPGSGDTNNNNKPKTTIKNQSSTNLRMFITNNNNNNNNDDYEGNRTSMKKPPPLLEKKM
ncbi:Rab GTPase domain-containing protein [Tieghemostelium lacteum]|uniref:Rab GTPase domain-containing protein n=1 Tax=Tieghemostelium lacteum TaxID=361077 RepID=A0A151ZDK4_TIELA|nr:Rab GTPase domain-containing protein [Tieghemostelium lacteum]|eukprot:KYQ92027.1 Rab GTPase domain-containing protein [Tieghemostelium lacteum]